MPSHSSERFHYRGLLRIDMRGPDGNIYPMKGVIHEIVEPECLVFTSTALEDENGKPLFEILKPDTHSGARINAW